jgi:aldehyde dehydrogenase (NAD+)
MLAASQFLTPVSLELGGKSPVIIDKSVTDVEVCARRVIWGKFANAGQTCIAPDYVLCHESNYDKFVTTCKQMITNFYGAVPKNSADFGRIVSKGHCLRLKAMLAESKGNIVAGGECDEEEKFISPTLITDVSLSSSLMQDEIFGPLLPILTYNNIDDALNIIRDREKPLALYIFSKDKKMIDTVIHQIQSGGVVINDVMMHFGNSFAPFGGIGNSGMGGYHGWYSFECFSHKRAVLHRNDQKIFDVYLRYPPATPFALSFFKWIFKAPALPAVTSGKLLKWSTIGALTAAVIALGIQKYKDA